MSHCLGCWDAPSLGPILVFSQFQVLLSHLWEFKEKKEGRRDKKGKKGRMNDKTRKKEREEEGVKR